VVVVVVVVVVGREVVVCAIFDGELIGYVRRTCFDPLVYPLRYSECLLLRCNDQANIMNRRLNKLWNARTYEYTKQPSNEQKSTYTADGR
jgi:hypothetical protein